MRARYYSVELMRFINEDIVLGDIGNSSSLNRYTYVEGNPATMVDPFGLEAEKAGYKKAIISSLNTISDAIDSNILLSLVFGDIAIVADLATDLLEGNYKDAAINSAILLTSALLGRGVGMVAEKAAIKLVSKLGKGTLKCVVASAAKGAITGGITGAAVGGYANGMSTYYESDGDMEETLKAFVGGTTSGFLWGTIGGAVSGAAKSSLCFIAGTQITVIDGKKAIEEIVSGDYVLAYNPDTKEKAYKKVLETYINETYELVHVSTSEDEIVSTPAHPFYVVDKGWIEAEELEIGDSLLGKDGSHIIVKALTKELLDESVEVYNFAVEDFHTYYVASGVLVHNRCESEGGKKTVEVNGKSVTLDNNTFDPNLVDKQGRTNIQRMEQGLSPIGTDGKSVNIHHIDQTNDGPVMEITATKHQQNYSELHTNTGQSPSQVDRKAFNIWRNDYWKWRGNNLE